MWWFGMEVEECKISVWVCREEKLVSGVTRRTSCADIVRVLLEDRSSPALAGSAQSYCIVEKWRGFERVLPNRTKILRLWTAWGREQPNVRFVLVRSDASLPGSGPRSAEARVVHSKESRCADKCDPATTEAVATAEEEISQEKRRRVVRKAFRKLEKINRKKEETCAEEYAERMETLVHLVLSQDHTIRQQTQRIRELDGEIDRHEARVHTDRIRRHGINYVQDTYLVDAGDSASAGAGAELDADTMARCDQVIRLQEQLTEQHALLERLTGELQEELDRRWMTRRDDGDAEEMQEITLALAETPVSEKDVLIEEERIKTQLDTSSYIGLRLNTDLETVQSELDASLELWEAKERELRDLLEKMDSCGGCDEDAGEGDAVFTDEGQPPPPPPPPSSVDHSDCWVERVRGLSKTKPGGNDDDSDTGLSSMHSQDSDNAAVCESLV